MSYTYELFDNNFSFISSFISLQSISKKKKKKLLCAYFWEGAYYRSLISSLQQMRLLLGGAYYRGALIIGSLRYFVFLLHHFLCIFIGKGCLWRLKPIPLPKNLKTASCYIILYCIYIYTV